MVAHSGGSHGADDMIPGMPNGSSSSSSNSGGSGGCSIGMAKTALKKGPWTAAEDTILIEYVKKHGEGNWNAVQKNTSLSRCGKSCRLRWTNHLRPNLKKGSFTPEEERLIIQLHSQHGNKWARMAAQVISSLPSCWKCGDSLERTEKNILIAHFFLLLAAARTNRQRDQELLEHQD